MNARVSKKNILSERCSSFIDTSYLEESKSELNFSNVKINSYGVPVLALGIEELSHCK